MVLRFVPIWLLLTATGLLNGCASLSGTERPYLSIIGLEIEEATLMEQRYRIKLRVQNANDRDLYIDGLSYQLAINDEPFVRGVSNRSFIVPRYGEVVTEVDGTSTIFGFLRQLRAMQEQKPGQVNYLLTGELSLQDQFTNMSFSYQGKIVFAAPTAASPWIPL